MYSLMLWVFFGKPSNLATNPRESYYELFQHPALFMNPSLIVFKRV